MDQLLSEYTRELMNKRQRITQLENLVFDLHRRISILEGKADPGIYCERCDERGKIGYGLSEENCPECDGKRRVYPEIEQ